MAETVVEASVQILIEKLLALATDEIGLILGVKADMKKLKKSLDMVRAVLNDAAIRQVKEESVKLWLKELKDITYEADNLVDEFQYETHRRKVEINNQMKRKVCFSFCFTNPLCFRSKMGHAIRNLNAELKSLYEQANTLGLRTLDSPYINPVTEETTPVNGEEVVGRENHASKILAMVVKSSDELAGVSFLPITGMGGLGKTTLARLIFKDPEAIKHFDERIWVCVSTNFDTKTLFIQMLGSLGKSVDQYDNMATITQKLQSLLRDRRYLLILDDLWHGVRRDWEGFKNTLLGFSSRKGNFIITTTRLETVASMVNPDSIYRLDELSVHDCWSVIKRKAFPTGVVPGEFETIGYKIAFKCKGLPLAANLIGASLQGKEIGDWTSVLERQLSDAEPGVEKILKVSYDRLPYLYRKCFAYCAIFCKDAKLGKEQLIQLWIAEGFLSESDKMDMESVGSNVYDTLLKSSFLQEVVRDEYGNIEHCKMHDLVHDLAISVSKDDCFNDETNDQESRVVGPVRYLAVESPGEESHKILKENAIYLRTLCLGSSLADDIFRDLKRLHVLNLSGSRIQELSSSVGGLIHLRLLDVSETKLATLPDSICKLYNLQTLNIYKCEELRRLPGNVHLLFNMRHLVFAMYRAIETPSNIGKLNCLRTLRVFSVGLVKGQRIEELGPLKYLKGELLIQGLENVKDEEEAMKSDLIGKPNIQQLSLEWANDVASNSEGEVHDEGNNHKGVLEGLEPHPNIKVLGIENFKGDKFPAWAMNMKINDGRSLDKLVRIQLINCSRCEEIPTMGHLPFLKELRLEGLTNVKSIGPSFYNYRENSGKTTTSFQPLVVRFQALEEFYMISMPNLVEWVAPTAQISTTSSSTTASKVPGFPLLKFLKIEHTPKLKAIPSHDLGSLETLVLKDIEESSLFVNMACNNNLISLRELTVRSCKISNDGVSKLIQSSQHHLESLIIWGCDELSHLEFPDDEEEDDDDDGHSRILPSLHELDVLDCPELACVALETPNLSSLRIKGCKISNDGLSKLIQSNQHHLESLSITRCDELTQLELPDDDGQSRILPSLKSLTIWFCERLESIGFRSGKCRPIPSLLSLSIWECPNLASVAFETANLSTLRIERCKISNDGVSKLIQSNQHHLERLTIWGCDELNHLEFPDDEEEDDDDDGHSRIILPSLKNLVVRNCDRLESIGFRSGKCRPIPSLRDLRIWKCPNLASVAFETPNLSSLSIDGCKISNDGVRKLIQSSQHHLERLVIMDCNELTHLDFPDDDGQSRILPSLKVLHISRCYRLESIGFRSGKCQPIPSLRDLRIWECPNLTSVALETPPTF